MTLGIQGYNLIKEAKHSGNEIVPFNEAIVRSLIRELKFFLNEITITLESTQSKDIAIDQATSGKIQFLHNTIKHYKRCLIAYQLKRIEIIRKNYSKLGSHHEERENLSCWECDFLNSYTQAIQTHYNDKYPVLDWNEDNGHIGEVPPQDLYVIVRVLEECGDVVTENGVLSLQKGSLLNVLRSDISHLVSSGHLEII